MKVRLIKRLPQANAPELLKRLLFIGNSMPAFMKEFTTIRETELQSKAIINLLPMQDREVYNTFAVVNALNGLVVYHPIVTVQQGLRVFLSWFEKQYF